MEGRNRLQTYRTRTEEITYSTSSGANKTAALAALDAEYSKASRTDYEAFLGAISEKRKELAMQLGTWKHAADPALTNLLLVLTSGGNLAASQLAVMAAPFEDDFISINAIRAAAVGAGFNTGVLENLQSDVGRDPEKVLTSFEKSAHIAFLSSPELAAPTLSTLFELSTRGAAGKDISVDGNLPNGSIVF